MLLELELQARQQHIVDVATRKIGAALVEDPLRHAAVGIAEHVVEGDAAAAAPLAREVVLDTQIGRCDLVVRRTERFVLELLVARHDVDVRGDGVNAEQVVTLEILDCRRFPLGVVVFGATGCLGGGFAPTGKRGSCARVCGYRAQPLSYVFRNSSGLMFLMSLVCTQLPDEALSDALTAGWPSMKRLAAKSAAETAR